MNSFSIIEILFAAGIIQGLFLSFSFYRIKGQNNSANNTLALLLLMSTVLLFGKVFGNRLSDTLFLRLGTFLDFIVFLFGPLVYSYVRKFFFQEKKEFRLHIAHYIPLGLFLIYYFWTLSFSVSEFSKMAQETMVLFLFFMIELTGILLLIFYTYKLIRLKIKYNRILKNQISYRPAIALFFNIIIIVFVTFIIFWSISFYTSYIIRVYNRYINYNTMWIIVSVFVYFVGYFALKRPEIFRMPIVSSSSKQKKERLEPVEIKKLQHKLDEIVAKEQIFLQSDLNLNMLAERLGTSPNNLSWLLNRVYKKTFYEFINTLRIKVFIEKIEEGEHRHRTLLGLAIDSGFNSKSTFNNSFKAIMNDSPSNYIKNLKTTRNKIL